MTTPTLPPEVARLRDLIASLLEQAHDPARKHPETSPAKGRWTCITARSEQIEELRDALAHLSASAAARPDEVDSVGFTREQWVDHAVRVYRACGDTESEARELAEALADEQDWHAELDDPFEMALADIEGRPVASAAAQGEAVEILRELVESTRGGSYGLNGNSLNAWMARKTAAMASAEAFLSGTHPAPPASASAPRAQEAAEVNSDTADEVADHIEKNWKLAERDPRDIAKDIRTLARFYREHK